MEVLLTIATIIIAGFSMIRGVVYLVQQNNVKKGLLWFLVGIAASGVNYLFTLS